MNNNMCKECPSHSTSVVGAANLFDCKCDANHFISFLCETTDGVIPFGPSECETKGTCKDQDGNIVVGFEKNACVSNGTCKEGSGVVVNYDDSVTCESESNGKCKTFRVKGSSYASYEETEYLTEYTKSECTNQGRCVIGPNYNQAYTVYNDYDKTTCENYGVCLYIWGWAGSMRSTSIKTSAECPVYFTAPHDQRIFTPFVWKPFTWVLNVWTPHTFAPATYSHCRACPPHSFQPLQHQTSCECEAGYRWKDDVCVKCEANEYQDQTGQTTCKACPADRFATVKGATDIANCTESCEDGEMASFIEVYNTNNCQGKANELGLEFVTRELPSRTCYSMTHSENKLFWSEGQWTWGDTGGEYGETPLAQCVTCENGKYSNIETGRQCTECPIGWSDVTTVTNNVPKSTCGPCPGGKTTSDTGFSFQTLASYNINGQIDGYYTDSGCDVDCSPGTFSSGGGPCQNCSINTFSSGYAAAECQNCSAGFTSDVGSTFCRACAAGKVSNGQGGACQTCQANHYTTGIGESACLPCPADTESSNGFCEQCPEGNTSWSGQSCQPCLGGTYTPAGGDCAACQPGQFSVAVPVYRTQNITGTRVATTERNKTSAELSVETYTSWAESMSWTQDGLCWKSPYPPSSYAVRVYERSSDNPGTDKQQLSRCRDACMYKKAKVGYTWRNQNVMSENFGFSMDASGRCYCEQVSYQSCSEPKRAYYYFYSFSYTANDNGQRYSNNKNNNNDPPSETETVEQIECAGTGRYYYNRGASRVSGITGTQRSIGNQYGFKECVEAVRNHATYGRDGTDEAVGAYLAGYGYSTCYAITGSMTTPTDSSSGSKLACKFDIETEEVVTGTEQVLIEEGPPEMCTVCPAGQYQDLGGKEQCKGCPVGTFLDATGSQSVDDCQACPQGTYNDDVSASQCKGCPTGKFLNVTGSSADDCQDCAAGKFAAGIGQGICQDCAAGKFATNQGQEVCQDCAAGKFATNQGQEVCQDCAAGKFAVNQGQEVCQDCLAGKFATNQGQEVCQDCAAGKFAMNQGQEECDDCPIHRAQPDTGKTFCQKCSDTQSQPLTGQTTCIDCADGEMSFYDGTVSECRDACDAGAYVDGDNCHPCPLGQFSDVRHTEISCKTCAPGTVSKDDRTGCDACAAGRFYNSSTLACVECPAGQYQDEEGQLVCKNPPANVFGMNDVYDDKTRVCPYTTTHYRDSSGCHACENLKPGYICQKRMPEATETKTERNKVIHSDKCIGDFKLEDNKFCSENECVDGFYFEDEHCHSCADAKEEYEAMVCDDDNRSTLKQLIDTQCNE